MSISSVFNKQQNRSSLSAIPKKIYSLLLWQYLAKENKSNRLTTRAWMHTDFKFHRGFCFSILKSLIYSAQCVIVCTAGTRLTLMSELSWAERRRYEELFTSWNMHSLKSASGEEWTLAKTLQLFLTFGWEPLNCYIMLNLLEQLQNTQPLLFLRTYF